jgi:predicted transcriptional regulator
MHLLEDSRNLQLLKYLVSGEGISVKINAIARDLHIHRATAKKKVEFLFDENLLTRPFHPFSYLYNTYPLLVLAKADMPRSKAVIDFLKDDSHIFAAFSCMEGPYNTFLIEFFKDLESYHHWREKIVNEYRIPSRETRTAADTTIFSNKFTFKNDPTCFSLNLQNEFKKEKSICINDIVLDEPTSMILINLLNGKFIQRNDTFLSTELGINRKTVKNKLEKLMQYNIIERPKCFFPNLFVPPGYNLIVSLIEVKTKMVEIREYIKHNNNIARAQEASIGRYNFLLFSAFKAIEDFFNMGEELSTEFSGSIGGIENIFLSSKMIHTIKPQKLSLSWIERRLWEQKHK